MARKSSQEVGTEHAARLQKWVSETSLNAVPRNYAGQSSKSAICRILGIATSTIGTNERIREIFNEFDLKLARSSTTSRRTALPLDGKPSIDSWDINSLLNENDALRAELARLHHLSNTGHWILK
jgi:hypothetical protein